MSNNIKTVGLFGTCGSSVWRDAFVAKFESEGVEFFNPQVDDWTPECAVVEAEHLAGDAIIAMAVTNETSGLASIVEAGLMVARAIMEPDKSFVLFVEPVSESTFGKDAFRARKLLIEHLGRFKEVKNLYRIESLDAMLELTLLLWEKLEA